MNKVVMISGGTSGIGKGVVVELIASGYRVATFSNDPIKGADLKMEIKSDNLLIMDGDVTDEARVMEMVDEVQKKWGQIDILINNAGVGYYAECDKMEKDKFEKMLDINVVGLAIVTKAVVPDMKKRKEGLIINMASIAGKTGFPLGEFYSASKFGVMGYSEAIRNELKEFGIKVCTICPGMVKTEFLGEEEMERRKKIGNGELPPMLEISEVVRVVKFICDETNGCDIRDITVVPH